MLTAADSGGRRAQEAKGAPVRPDPESVEGRVDMLFSAFAARHGWSDGVLVLSSG